MASRHKTMIALDAFMASVLARAVAGDKDLKEGVGRGRQSGV